MSENATQEDLRELIEANQRQQRVREHLYASGRWYRLPRVLHEIRPHFFPEQVKGRPPKRAHRVKLKLAAYTLAAMLNQESAQEATLKNNGWFKFCGKKTTKDTGFGEKTQYTHIELLRRCKLIYKPRRAHAVLGHRLLKINWDRLDRYIDEVLLRSVSSVNSTELKTVSSVNSTELVRQDLPNSTCKKGIERRGKGAGGATPRNATPPETPTSTGNANTGSQGSSRPTTPPATVQEGNGSGRAGHAPPNNPAPVPKKKEEGLVPNPRRTRKATWRTADTPHAAAARQLHKALRDAGRVTDGKSDDCWSTPLKKVIKSDSDHQKVLDWFCINCSRDQTQKHGLPTITNGTQYAKRYEWIRDCWSKAVGKTKGWTRRNGGKCLEGDNDDSEAREEWVS